MASDKKKNTVLLDNVYSELSLFFACNVMRFLLFAKTRDFLVYNCAAISRASNPRYFECGSPTLHSPVPSLSAGRQALALSKRQSRMRR
jgi:hypothetical protein